MISFNVGPSKVYPEVKQYLQDAFDNQILSISHRSKEFDAFSKRTIELLHSKLNIPNDYVIMYTGSATESWEIISQDIVNSSAVHFFNGEFGKKWFEYAQYIVPTTKGFAYNENSEIEIEKYEISSDVELLGFTLNETSTGTQVKMPIINKAKSLFPNALIAIDTTSCLGGINIEFSKFDIIYGSVQKCFGLPSGLGILICSPKAMEKAKQKNIKGRYNSLLKMAEHVKAYQTSYTPNVLNIYLLSRVLENFTNTIEVGDKLKVRAKNWYAFFNSLNGFDTHITNESVQSDTVITVKAKNPENIAKIKSVAKKSNIELGSGYGPLKESTFRIANFPAIEDSEIEILKSLLLEFDKSL